MYWVKYLLAIAALCHSVSSFNDGRSSLVRICFQRPNENMTAITIGMYISPNFVLMSGDTITSNDVKDWKDTILYLGGANMDCKTGQSRHLVKFVPFKVHHFDSYLLKISKPFILTEDVTRIKMTDILQTDRNNCYSFCKFRFIELQQNTKNRLRKVMGAYINMIKATNLTNLVNKAIDEIMDGCKSITSYKHELVAYKNHRGNEEMSLQTNDAADYRRDKYSFLVCNGKLIGYVGAPRVHNAKGTVKLYGIADYIDDIEKIIEKNEQV